MIETDTLDSAVIAERSRHSGTPCYLAYHDRVVETRRGLVRITDDDTPELDRFTAGWHPGGFYDGGIYSMPNHWVCRADVFDAPEMAEARRQQWITQALDLLRAEGAIR